MVDKARASYYPEIDLQGNARAGHDVDGYEGRTTEFGVRVVAKWNLYRGGIDTANEQEQVRRASEKRYELHQVYREVEDAVRTSWNRRERQLDLEKTLRAQAATDDKLVSSYRQQFRVGQRSLLDVLDAQNTRISTDILAMTSRYAVLFANYRLLAATGEPPADPSPEGRGAVGCLCAQGVQRSGDARDGELCAHPVSPDQRPPVRPAGASPQRLEKRIGRLSMEAVKLQENAAADVGGFPFKASFRTVASALGRPNSETVLFSGVPFDPMNVTFEDIDRLATRLGLEAFRRTKAQLACRGHGVSRRSSYSGTG